MTDTEAVVERNLELCGVKQPKRIWLMVYRHAGDVCWTSDPNPEDADEIDTVEYVRADIAEQQAATIAERDARIDGLEAGLRRILTLRPAGDVSTATNTRTLVQQTECIARATLERTASTEGRRG